MAEGRKRWIQMLLLSTFLAVSMSGVWAEEKSKEADKVALVNGAEITRRTFDREMDRVQRSIIASGKGLAETELTELQKKVLESLIDRELLYQETRKKRVQVKEEDINEQVETLKKKYPKEDDYKEALTRMGFDEALLKKEIERGLAINNFVSQEFKDKSDVPEEEIKAYYDGNPKFFTKPEQVRASHILAKIESGGPDVKRAEVKKKMEGIRERLKNGEDFGALAKEYSECPSAERGGDLDYFSRGQMVKPFEDAAFSLKTGETSDIVETQFGYHLIKVTDKRPETKVAYDSVKDRIKQYLSSKKLDTEIRGYLDIVRENAKVERFL